MGFKIWSDVYDKVFDATVSSRILSNIALALLNSKLPIQSQRQAATETAAFVYIFRYNAQSWFHLENDF